MELSENVIKIKKKKKKSNSSKPILIQSDIDIQNMEGLKYLDLLDDKSVDLILTDPPYIISRDSGMNKHYNDVKKNEKEGIDKIKTEKEWKDYKKLNNIKNDDNKSNYLKYGTIYGTKYAVKTDYGDWDKNFSIEILEEFIKKYYKKLRNGGTIIIFNDLWKITI
jgi:site-specific DNA-methyltransferase (adenine-specific)